MPLRVGFFSAHLATRDRFDEISRMGVSGSEVPWCLIGSSEERVLDAA